MTNDFVGKSLRNLKAEKEAEMVIAVLDPITKLYTFHRAHGMGRREAFNIPINGTDVTPNTFVILADSMEVPVEDEYDH